MPREARMTVIIVSPQLSGLPRSMRLKFTKMHGLGNDFVVLDATRAPLALSRDQLRRIADRHFGVGCDQILQVEAARAPDTDFYYRIFNADGGEVEQCGNGARCFVRFVREQGLTDKTEIRVGTAERRDRAARGGRWPGHGRHGRAGIRAGAHSV